MLGSLDFPPGVSADVVDRLQVDNLKRYAAFNPVDATEAFLIQQMLVVGNVSMGCYRRASGTKELRARDIELRLGIKATLTSLEAIKWLDARRGRNQTTVNVAQVNVEPGAQAFVGNVELPERQPRATISPTSTGSDEPSEHDDD